MATGGAIPKIQAYPSGACYHTSCAVELILRSTAHYANPVAHSKELLEKVEFLARCTPQTERDSVLEAQQWLRARLQEGDPLHTDRALDLLEQTMSIDGAAAPLTVGSKPRQPRISLSLPEAF